MLGLNPKGPFGLPPGSLQDGTSFPEALRRACLAAGPQLQGNIFGGGFEESSLILARAEALAAAAAAAVAGTEHPQQQPQPQHPLDASPAASPGKSQPFKQPLDCAYYHPAMSSLPAPHPHHHHPHHHHHHHHSHHHHPQGLDVGGDLLELMGAPSEVLGSPMLPPQALPPPPPHPPPPGSAQSPDLSSSSAASAASAAPAPSSDPRELEAFAERFKQRRIKLGVTQADVGAALASLKLPGVGSLSQSTICRFESLTLSPNNMLALQPVLHAWLEEAEAAHRRERRDGGEGFGGGGGGGGPPAGLGLERKRKRTSIAAPEKRSLEAYFALQPRPSSEKIAAIAEKLELKKNVVRVWFCNQRQKQKRMKYSALH